MICQAIHVGYTGFIIFALRNISLSMVRVMLNYPLQRRDMNYGSVIGCHCLPMLCGY
jgi:hypothetical protein